MKFTCSDLVQEIITTPEGAAHPVVLGMAGVCAECDDGIAITRRSIPLPTEVIIHPADDSPWDFCHCRPCDFVREGLQARGARV